MPFVTSAGRRKQRQNRVNALDLQMIDAGNRYDQRYSQTAPELIPDRPPNALGIDTVRRKNLLRANSGRSDFADYRMQNRVLEAGQAPVLQAKRAKGFSEAALSNQMTDMAPQIAGAHLGRLRLPLSEFDQKVAQQQFKNKASTLAASNTQSNEETRLGNETALNTSNIGVNQNIIDTNNMTATDKAIMDTKTANALATRESEAAETLHRRNVELQDRAGYGAEFGYGDAYQQQFNQDPNTPPRLGATNTPLPSPNQLARTDAQLVGLLRQTGLDQLLQQDGNGNYTNVDSLASDSYAPNDSTISFIKNLISSIENAMARIESEPNRDNLMLMLKNQIRQSGVLDKVKRYQNTDALPTIGGEGPYGGRFMRQLNNPFTATNATFKRGRFLDMESLAEQLIDLVESDAPQL